ncbi:MAG: SH3 domain-containing protein [Phototrophicales bacterium]|nr:SH3 domain-containing protein [Phototrophicales bacterium]
MGKRIFFGLSSTLLVLLLGLTMLTFSPIATVDAQTFGTGPWSATFYNRPDFTDPSVCTATSTYTILNFTWGGVPTQADGATPVPCNLPPDNFSVQFSSTQAFTAGTYTFSVTGDDAVRLNLNGTQIIQILTPSSQSVQVSVPGGNVLMEVFFTDFSGNASLSVTWTLSGAVGVSTPIGTPTFAGPVGPIGNVVNVRGLSLRTGPYLGASLIGVLVPGIAYPVLAQNTDEGGGYTWYQVQNGDRIGWASGRYLVVNNGTPPYATTVFEQIDLLPDTGITGEPNAYMNIRRRPSTRSTIIGEVPWGGRVTILGRTIRNGASYWMHIRYDGITGWIYAPYVKNIRGNNIGSAPTR